MPVQTQYELTGDWTSVADGEVFLQTISTETGVHLDSIGKSVEGRDLWRLTMGSGNNLILITSGVHGTEPASREAILMMARNVSYNSSGQYTEYLTNHKIMIIPTMNPDRMHVQYRNAQHIDINRGMYPLDSPEAIAFAKVLIENNPDMFVDFHERSGTSDQIQFVRAMHLDPNSDETVRSSTQNALSFIMSNLAGMGYDAGYYPEGYTGFGSNTSGAGILGYIAFTAETFVGASSADLRISMHKATFDLALEWHSQNQSLIKSFKEKFLNDMIKPNNTFILLTGLEDGKEFYPLATKVPIITPEGYNLVSPADFSLWQNVYGMLMSTDGFVPINQRAGRMIPHLLDPGSDIAVRPATRKEPLTPPERTDGRYTKVLYTDGWRDVFVKNYLNAQ